MKRFLTSFVLLTVTMAQLAAPAQAVHRDVLGLVGSVFAPISQREEVLAGAQLDQKVREKYPATSNAALQNYVSSVGKKISSRTETGYPFTYTVLADTRTANAFAGPGGFIYITTGMINMLENESQLAAALAHETGHVIRRHSVRQIQEQSAANLAIGLLSQVTDRDLNNRLTQLGEYLLFQRFSRADETEADIVGTQLMVNAGYNPEGMVQLLDKLNKLDSQGIVIGFLQSHPPSAARAQTVREYIDRNKLVRPGQITDTRQFHLVVP